MNKKGLSILRELLFPFSLKPLAKEGTLVFFLMIFAIAELCGQTIILEESPSGYQIGNQRNATNGAQVDFGPHTLDDQTVFELSDAKEEGTGFQATVAQIEGAQTVETSQTGPTNDQANESAVSDASELPRGFREIKLGLDFERVEELLRQDPYFIYRGGPDVSMLSSPGRTMVQVDAVSYLDKAYFQFYQDTLYIITLVLDRERIDYYTMFVTLQNKYGGPTDLDPQKSVWESARTSLSLEKPLAVKYIDLKIFNQLQDAGKAKESFERMNKETFLQNF